MINVCPQESVAVDVRSRLRSLSGVGCTTEIIYDFLQTFGRIVYTLYFSLKKV